MKVIKQNDPPASNRQFHRNEGNCYYPLQAIFNKEQIRNWHHVKNEIISFTERNPSLLLQQPAQQFTQHLRTAEDCADQSDYHNAVEKQMYKAYLKNAQTMQVKQKSEPTTMKDAATSRPRSAFKQMEITECRSQQNAGQTDSVVEPDSQMSHHNSSLYRFPARSKAFIKYQTFFQLQAKRKPNFASPSPERSSPSMMKTVSPRHQGTVLNPHRAQEYYIPLSSQILRMKEQISKYQLYATNLVEQQFSISNAHASPSTSPIKQRQCQNTNTDFDDAASRLSGVHADPQFSEAQEKARFMARYWRPQVFNVKSLMRLTNSNTDFIHQHSSVQLRSHKQGHP